MSVWLDPVSGPLMVRWVVGSILHGEPIGLFPAITSVPQLVQKKRSWYVLICLWDGAYKRTLADNRNCIGDSGFLLSLSERSFTL